MALYHIYSHIAQYVVLFYQFSWACRKPATEKSVTLNSLPVKAGGTLATVDIRPSKPRYFELILLFKYSASHIYPQLKFVLLNIFVSGIAYRRYKRENKLTTFPNICHEQK